MVQRELSFWEVTVLKIDQCQHTPTVISIATLGRRRGIWRRTVMKEGEHPLLMLVL